LAGCLCLAPFAPRADLGLDRAVPHLWLLGSSSCELKCFSSKSVNFWQCRAATSRWAAAKLSSSAKGASSKSPSPEPGTPQAWFLGAEASLSVAAAWEGRLSGTVASGEGVGSCASAPVASRKRKLSQLSRLNWPLVAWNQADQAPSALHDREWTEDLRPERMVAGG